MLSRGIGPGIALFAALIVSTASVSALAQSTGGSFGGGSFGGGSSGASSSSSSSGGGYSGSSSSYSGGGGGGGGGGGCDMPTEFVVPFVLLFAILMIYNASQKGGIAGARQRAAAARSAKLDVTAVRLGIDWRARKTVQARLSELARAGETNSNERLAELLRETVKTLKEARIAWLYADVSDHQLMSAADAETAFRQHTTRARAEFREELIRNADGTTSSRDAPALKAHPNEGEGVVVVTLVVAAKRAIIDSGATKGVERLDALLEDLLAVAASNALAVLEVIWSPAAEDDRMSTAELEQHYPELHKLDEHAIAGRVFCKFCSGPFAMELLACPHCGAPIARSESAPPG